MNYFDVFNGDADGLCALHQLRLADPRKATLITGPKRDIALLERVAAQSGDHVTALDIALDPNRSVLLDLLQRGVSVDYFDHHTATEIPDHPLLHAVIDDTPDRCTSELVDRHVGGRFRAWAVVAAFGDNLMERAAQLALPLALSADKVRDLRDLGECLNYNAYGDHATDLLVQPAALYEAMGRHQDPFSFMRATTPLRVIREGRDRDLRLAAELRPVHVSPTAQVYVLPDEPWSRRVQGVLGNRLSAASSRLAVAVLTPNAQAGYAVSVRAPRDSMRGADAFCGQFPTGGGRPAAGGIRHLPQDALPEFIHRLDRAFATG